MTRAGTLMTALHLATGPDGRRRAIREYVDALEAPEWQALRDRERANPEARDRIDDAIVWMTDRVAGPHLVVWEEIKEATQAHAVIVDARARIILGELAQVSEETGLSQDEALRWSQSWTLSPVDWLLAEHGLSDGKTKYMAVARWAIRMASSPSRREALFAQRDIGGIGGSALRRLDELRPQDLSDSVVETLEAASRRQVEESWDGDDELAPDADWERRLPDGVTRLRYFSALHLEGVELRHCVGTDLSYAEGVRDGEREIFAIRAPDGTRATAQVSGGRIEQIRGPRNEDPSEACRRLAEEAAKIVP